MRTYPHMCRMDHEEIGFSTDSEMCPLCQSMAGCDQLNRENADLRARVGELEAERDHLTALCLAQVGAIQELTRRAEKYDRDRRRYFGRLELARNPS